MSSPRTAWIFNPPRSWSVLWLFPLHRYLRVVSSLGAKMPFCFVHPSPGPEQMVRLCWLSSLLLCFHGNVGHRDHLCLGLSDSLLWRRTSSLLTRCPGALEYILGPWEPGHWRDPLRTISLPMAGNWLESGGGQHPAWAAKANLGWQHIWTICPLSQLP